MRFILNAFLLMTSVSASTLVERPEHNTHTYKRADFEDVIKHYSKHINNKSEAYKFIELISTGEGEVGGYSFNGVGPLGTDKEHKLAFELLQDIGSRFGSNFYIPYGNNYDFVRTAVNYGALNKWFEESKLLFEKRKKKVEAVNKLSKVLNKKIDSKKNDSIKDVLKGGKIIFAEKELELKKAKMLEIRSQRQSLEKQEYERILLQGDEEISNSNLKEIWKLCKELLNMDQNEELCLFNEKGDISIDSVPKDLLGRLFTLIIEFDCVGSEAYRVRRLFNKDLITTTFGYNINIVDSNEFSEKEKDLLKSICISLVKKHGFPEIYPYRMCTSEYNISLWDALMEYESIFLNKESAEELCEWSLRKYKTESGLNYYQDLYLAFILSEKFEFSYEDMIKIFTLSKDYGSGILTNSKVDLANEKYLNNSFCFDGFSFSKIHEKFIKEFLTKFADGSEKSIIVLQKVLKSSTIYEEKRKQLISFGKDKLKTIFLQLNDYPDDRVIEILKKFLDLGIIDAASIREKFEEIKESNSNVGHDFITSLLKSKTGDLFNFSNDEIMEYRLQNQNGRPNIPHIVAAAEYIMRNQRPYLRRHINNVNNINVGNNWGATETIMNSVNAIDEIKIFYSGEKYKDNAETIIYAALKKFSSPKKSLEDLIAEFGCDDFSKVLNDFDAQLNKVKQQEYSVYNRMEILKAIDDLKKDLNKAIRDYTTQNIKNITKYKESYEKFYNDKNLEKKDEASINKLICDEFYKNFYTDYFEKIIKGILIETQLKRSEKILPMVVDIIENTDAVVIIKDMNGKEKAISLKEDYENFFNGMVDAAIANNDEKKEKIGDTCQFDRFVQSSLKTYVPFIELFNLGADVVLKNNEFEVWKKMQGMCKDFEKIIKKNFEKIAVDSGFNNLLETYNRTLLKERTERYISFVKSHATKEILEKLKIENGADDKFFESIEKEMSCLTYALSEEGQIDDSIDAVLGKVKNYVLPKLDSIVTDDAKKIYIREFIKRIFSVFSVNYENLSYEESMNDNIDEMFKKMGLSETEFEEKRSNDKLIENAYNTLNGKGKELGEIVNEIYDTFGGDPDPSIEGDIGSPVTKEEIGQIVQNIKSKEKQA